ncbi:hypothetical protein [Paenibacillus antibioticophila]|uniref:hypothetical protein n=1 Tax=Paenibacillus antibioticophila TaxID=1274374 RepID=UPI001CA3248B|nr:hypothetical protein [Paenibacillus antibioticophila]
MDQISKTIGIPIYLKGSSYLLLGNENLKMANHFRFEAKAIHVPHLIKNKTSFTELLKAAKIENKKIGVVGWKVFTSY